MSLTKTVQTDLSAWVNTTNGNVAVGTEYNCAGDYAGSIAIRIGRQSNTGFTSGWPNIRIEANPASSGGSWVPIYSYQMAVGASLANATLNGQANSGNTSFVVNSATNIAAGDILFVSDNTTTNFELVRVKSISGTTVTLEEALVNTHVNAAVVIDQAEMSFPSFSLLAYKRLRAVIDNANSGATIASEVKLTTTSAI